MTSDSSRGRSNCLRLFTLSFIALFLELMVIRWVPSVVRLVAYFSNLMLISSFLGLAVGSMLGRHRWRLFDWFPLLLAVDIAFLLVCREIALPGSGSEHRFYDQNPGVLNYAILVVIVVANVITFVPLGQSIGSLFHALPALRAYTWDLAGSLAGTLCFGVFSFTYFSPLLGMCGVMVLFLALCGWRQWVWSVPLFGFVLGALVWANRQPAIWSPYYHITVFDEEGNCLVPHERAPQLTTVQDTPLYTVCVNQDFFQYHATIDNSRYTTGVQSERDIVVSGLRDQRLLPYQLCSGRQRVAIMGAGGGMDVE